MTEVDFLQVLDGQNLAIFDPARLAVPPVGGGSPGRPEPDAFRPLIRPSKSTTQPCSVAGCHNTAAFKTRSKPTWCDEHITEILRTGGLQPLEPFTNADDWRLTRCLSCGCQAHYRLEYTLDKNRYGEATCRACYWREWALMVRDSGPTGEGYVPVSREEFVERATANGVEYLDALTSPSLQHDPHLVKCLTCERRAVFREYDFGCSCRRK